MKNIALNLLFMLLTPFLIAYWIGELVRKEYSENKRWKNYGKRP